MNLRPPLLPAALATFLAACAPVETAPDMQGAYRTIALRLNESARVERSRVTPISVREDSRCPAAVQCVWAGTVRLNMRIVTDGNAMNEIVSLGEPRKLGGSTLWLVAVCPGTVAGAPLAPRDYRFVFAIAKGETGTPSVSQRACKA